MVEEQQCFKCGSRQQRWVTTTVTETFEGGHRLVLEQVPKVECSVCGQQIQPWEVAEQVRIVLRHMEHHGPYRARFDDPRWQPLIDRRREEDARATLELAATLEHQEPVPIEHFLAATEPAGAPPSPWPTHCERCGATASWQQAVDAMCCPACDTCLEPLCTDRACTLCHGRPTRPSRLAGR